MIATLWFRLISTVKSIRYHKYMTGFTALSYAIGLLLPTLILSGTYHEITQLRHSFMKDSNRILQVEDQTRMFPQLAREKSARMSDKELLQQLSDLDDAVEQVFYISEQTSYLSYNKQYRNVNISYVNDEIQDQFSTFVKRGEWFHSAVSNECIIGTRLSRKLWQGSGINKEIRIGGTTCTIIGETDVLDYRVVKKDQWNKDNNDISGLTRFFVKLKEGVALDAVISKIHKLGGQYRVEPVKELNQHQLEYAYGAFSILLLLSLIALLYALLNIGNVISLLLNERRRKYGVQMALGSGRRGLFFEFYMELLMITSFSVVLVYFLIYFGKPIIEHYLFLIRINGYILFSVLTFNIGLCAILGMILTRKILKSDVVPLIRGTEV